jgi:hypothetical protein
MNNRLAAAVPAGSGPTSSRTRFEDVVHQLLQPGAFVLGYAEQLADDLHRYGVREVMPQVDAAVLLGVRGKGVEQFCHDLLDAGAEILHAPGG